MQKTSSFVIPPHKNQEPLGRFETGFFSLESGGLRPPQGKVLLVLPPVGVPGDSESGPKPFTSRPSRPSIIRITIF